MHTARLLLPLLLFACRSPAPSAPPPPAPAAAAAPGVVEAIAAIDRRVAAEQQGLQAHPDDWARLEVVAAAWRARAKLSGALEDYAAASEALDQAFAVAPEGAGPFLERARLDLVLHRVEQAAVDLDRAAALPLLGQPARAEIALCRLNLAQQRGDLAEAEAQLAAAEALRPDFAAAAAAAGLARLRGDEAAARAALDRAEERAAGLSGEALAFLDLERGRLALARGDLDGAAAAFDQAERRFPGQWSTALLRAEVAAARGQPDQAEALLRALLAQGEHAEALDALATLVQGRGDLAEATALIGRADALWRRWMERFPEAAMAHQVDHLLRFSEEADTALALAQRNFERRPSGESGVLLARAALAAGQTERALSLIGSILAGPWRPPDLYAVAAEVYARAGQPERAAAALKLASGTAPAPTTKGERRYEE